jgi:hypothetical protein
MQSFMQLCVLVSIKNTPEIIKHSTFLFLLVVFGVLQAQSQSPRTVINLNGAWDFDQTTTAFPSEKFTRTIVSQASRAFLRFVILQISDI